MSGAAFIQDLAVILASAAALGWLCQRAGLSAVVGYLVAMLRGELSYDKMDAAAWVGLPQFQTPEFHLGVLGLFVPVVLVLVAENIGHVKSVAAMTGQNLDGVSGRALMADGGDGGQHSA